VDDADRLRRLLDKDEIHEVIVRYCRGVDRGDPDLVLSAFHDDATDNHNGTVLPAREALLSAKGQPVDPAERGALGMPRITSHFLGNEYVELHGDVAGCETYFVATARFDRPDGAVDWVLGGRYVDRFERRAGEWRIAHRSVIYDWECFDEVPDAPAGMPESTYAGQALRGCRGTADESYAVLGTSSDPIRPQR
jgi:SnoaL-like domain